VTHPAGLDTWTHQMGTPEKQFILETNGSGVGLLDYDNDGWLDIYLVNGSTYDALTGKVTPPHAALFHNNHDGTFTDVTEQAGVTNDRWGFGVAIGDYNNDGWPDIYVTNFGKNRLYRNNHNGTFTDVAEQAGVQLGNWSTGATFGDYDGDGRLDLFVPGYVHFDMDHPPVHSKRLPGNLKYRRRIFAMRPGGTESTRLTTSRPVPWIQISRAQMKRGRLRFSRRFSVEIADQETWRGMTRARMWLQYVMEGR
jgi:enediyne biosynthesis protein E4